MCFIKYISPVKKTPALWLINVTKCWRTGGIASLSHEPSHAIIYVRLLHTIWGGELNQTAEIKQYLIGFFHTSVCIFA
jgi:hypothetical protein